MKHLVTNKITSTNNSSSYNNSMSNLLLCKYVTKC